MSDDSNLFQAGMSISEYLIYEQGEAPSAVAARFARMPDVTDEQITLESALRELVLGVNQEAVARLAAARAPFVEGGILMAMRAGGLLAERYERAVA